MTRTEFPENTSLKEIIDYLESKGSVEITRNFHDKTTGKYIVEYEVTE